MPSILPVRFLCQRLYIDLMRLLYIINRLMHLTPVQALSTHSQVDSHVYGHYRLRLLE